MKTLATLALVALTLLMAEIHYFTTFPLQERHPTLTQAEVQAVERFLSFSNFQQRPSYLK